MDDGEERAIEGTVVRMMPDYRVEFPLWDLGGPLEDRALLETTLGLSESLIDALAQWQAEWDEVCGAAVRDDAVPVEPPPPVWSRAHSRPGKGLFARLEREIDPRFEVRLHP